MRNILFVVTLLLSLSLFSQKNQYLNLDGKDDYAILDNSSYLVKGNKISMTGWFYPVSLSYGDGLIGFRGYGDVGTGGMYVLMLGNGNVEFRVATTSGT